MAAPEFLVVCEQIFSKKSLSFLWENRNKLDAGQLSIVNSLYNNRKKGSMEGSVRVEYKLARSVPGKLGFGRLYGTKGSMETLEREARGTLCEEFYHDIDVKNAHPVILHQFAKMFFERDMPEVRNYCDNRDAYLKAIDNNRDEAKTAFLKIMYGGKCEHAHLVAYEKEVSSFTRMLGNQEKYQELMVYLRKQDKNVYASLLAQILQTEERTIMLVMKKSLEAMGWSVDVLAYDGVMIRKNKNLTLTPEMLRQVEKDILNQTKYVIELVDKQFEKYDVPVEAGDVAPKISKTIYNERKAEFEKDHFYFGPTNSIAEINSNGTISFYEIPHAKILFNTFDFKHSIALEDRSSFIDLWLKDDSRRVYYEIDMKPSENPRVYSPPVTFKHEEGSCPEDDEKIVGYFNKLVNLASNENTVISEYIFKWLAHMVQKPFENPGTAIILTGRQGCGKDTLGDFISDYIIGRDYSHNYISTEQFWEKHDTGRFNKFFVKIEEASGFLNRQHIGDMKARVTSATLTINPKGQKALTTSNYNRFFMTTNEGNPVKIEDGNRRFMVTPCSAEKVGDMAFWADLRKTLFTPEGGAAIGRLLSEIDLSDFDPRVLPQNDFTEMLKEQDMSPEERFIKEWDGKETRACDLYTNYTHYCFENGLQVLRNADSFGRKLIPMVRDKKLFRIVTRVGALYHK